MRLKDLSYSPQKIITSSLAMLLGGAIGVVIIYFILPPLSGVIAPQTIGYHLKLISNTSGVFLFCVVLDLLMVLFVFEQIPSISLSVIIFSFVSKAQNIFYLTYLKIRNLNAVGRCGNPLQGGL